jgi:hypothetical protein
MRKALLVALTVAMVLVSACGSDKTSTGESVTTTSAPFEFDNVKWDKAGPDPSISAKMVCSAEARDDMDAALGIKATKISKPKWVSEDHIYSCDYIYPRGKITLSVKEMSSGDETTAYYDRVKERYGAKQELKGLGQGAWILSNGDVLVRKDYKTLLVDVSEVPKKFVPAMRRSDVALNVASVIMSCWTGY